MNNEENVQCKVPELPDLSYLPCERQREEVRRRAERSRERVQTAQAEGLQPMCIDYSAIGQLSDKLSKAEFALDMAAGALVLAGLGGSQLCRELTATAERLRVIREGGVLIYV